MSTISAQPRAPVEVEERHAFKESDVKRRLADQGGCCALCPAELGASFIRDHRIPRAIGGPTTYANLDLLCTDCNAVKTRADRKAIAKAERLARTERGERPAKQSIRSAGFRRDPLSWRNA